MEAKFWLNKWENNEIGFHKQEANPLLVEHFNALGLDEGARLFLPLCGKTLDIGWLLFNGYKVVGAELSEIAIEQLFAQMNLNPVITNIGNLKLYKARNIDIYVGDIFEITQDMLGDVDAIFDRAALVALPFDTRAQYSRHMIKITKNAPQLLITFEYDPTGVSGPPHSIPESEVESHYGKHYTISTLTRVDVAEGIKGKTEVIEHVWHLAQNS